MLGSPSPSPCCILSLPRYLPVPTLEVQSHVVNSSSQHTSATRSCWGAHWTTSVPFPPHFWEPRNTQTAFHGSFWHFLVINQPKPFPPPFLGSVGSPNPSSCFILSLPGYLPLATLEVPSHVLNSSSQRTSTTRSCWGARCTASKPVRPHSWEPWKTQTPFHALFWPFLNHPTPFPPFLGRTWAAQTPPDA